MTKTISLARRRAAPAAPRASPAPARGRPRRPRRGRPGSRRSGRRAARAAAYSSARPQPCSARRYRELRGRARTAQVVVATDLTRRYGEGDTAVDALAGVWIGFERDRFTAIMGPSGSGKSTLMHILAGLDKPTAGTVELDGVEITGLDDGELTELRRDKLGFVFQFFNLLPVLTAEENLVLPLSIAGRKPDEAWVEQLIQHRRPRGPPHPPAGRALRRPAAAGRGRPGAGLQTGGRLRRRADRQPRLEGERRRAAAAAPARSTSSARPW